MKIFFKTTNQKLKYFKDGLTISLHYCFLNYFDTLIRNVGIVCHISYHIYNNDVNIANSLKKVLSLIFPYPKTYFRKLDKCESFYKIINWVKNKQECSIEKTFHEWYVLLDDDIQYHFDEIRNKCVGMFHTLNIEPVVEMDEIYISSKKRIEGSSDTVFYNKHIDGPYYLFPLCSVYRCIVALNKNETISTHIDRLNEKYYLSDGDCLGFDFNREIHYIESKSTVNKIEEPRITLKLHFVLYPKYCYILAIMLKWLTTRYDRNARSLFLYTQTPNTLIKKLCANMILLTTKLTYQIETYVSFHNLFLISILGVVSMTNYLF